ncbi:MAG: AMP-binding protein [Gammaproteobacteria bacterium]
MTVILEALAQHAAHTPQRRAVTGSHDALTWQQLDGEVTRLATILNGARTLGTLLINGPAWVVTDLATLRAGIMHVPLPGFFSDGQLLHALQDAGLDTVITDAPQRIAELVTVHSSDTLWIAGRQYTRVLLQAVATRTHNAGTAKVTYTSGTTGTPRGVRLSRDTIETVAGALARAANAVAADRAMALLPLSILLENIGAVYVPVLSGAEILVPDPADTGVDGSSRVDAVRLAAALQTHRPTALIVPPGLLKLLTVLAQRESVPDSLRFIAVGGAPAGKALLEDAAACGLPVYQGYGLSEAGSVVALNTAAHNRPGSVGKLLPHVRALISETGEILVQGKTFSGYLGDPVRDSGALLATGDTGYFDADGFLYVTGRMRERIITAFGRNVSPEWIEAELLSHPSIAQAAVLGNEQAHLLAVLVPSGTNTTASMEAAIAATNARLPDYAQITSWLTAETPFSTASGELAPGGTPRRDVIEQHYLPPQRAAQS